MNHTHAPLLPDIAMDAPDDAPIVFSRNTMTGEIFDMDDSDTGSVISAAKAPGSDTPSPRQSSLRTASTDDDGLIMGEVEGAQMLLTAAAEEAARFSVEAAPPMLSAPRPPSVPQSPRARFNPASVHAMLTMQVASSIQQQHADTQPLLTTTPALEGRVATRTGSADATGTRLTLARASIAMRRCKVQFGDANTQPCMFCSRPFVTGHAVLTFSHILGAEDQQYCELTVGLICCDCAPVKISKEDARALPYKTFNNLFLLRRFSYFINMLQAMKHCPVPRLDCTYATDMVSCVNCEKPVHEQVSRSADSVLVVQNYKTREVAIFVVCTHSCRVNMERGVLPTMRSCMLASRELTETDDARVYYSPTNGYWMALPVDQTRQLFPLGLSTPDASLPFSIHGMCTNPMCFVCDCRQRNRTKRIGKAQPRVGTMVRRAAASKDKSKAPDNSSDNFRWLEAMIELLKKENALLDLLGENSDDKCRGCGKICKTICQRCQAAALCSTECAKRSKHAERCLDAREFWTEVIRH